MIITRETSGKENVVSYALDAAVLLEECVANLQRTIDQDLYARHDSLYDLKGSLLSCEQFLHRHLVHILDKERNGLIMKLNDSPPPHNNKMQDLIEETSSLIETTRALKKVLKEKRRLGPDHHHTSQQQQQSQPLW